MRCIIALFAGLVCVVTANAQPAQIIIIRHAEKMTEGPDLNLKGRERAAALAPYFRETPEVLEYKTPVAIYVQKSSTTHPSRRPLDTIKPLAEVLKLSVIQFEREESAKMIAEIKNKPAYQGKMVLICWSHASIADMAKAFGVNDAPKWPDGAFDRTWIITFAKDGSPTFRNLPQKLMYGDAEK